MQKKCKTGFTLIEVLVVVLIIGVLTAIAVPQYQKAVLKSRFSSLLLTAKAVRDGNEAYFLTHGAYAGLPGDLDVTTSNNNDTTLSLSRDPQYAYVLATRPDLSDKNNLIMYQKHSVNFPGEIHCEALKDDAQANWLCQTGMHAVKSIGEVLTSNFNTYVLEGKGNGVAPEVEEEGPSCNKALAAGYTCEITDNNSGGHTKRICLPVSGTSNYCITTEYNADDAATTRTTCATDPETGVCNDTYKTTYDEEGRPKYQQMCSSVDSEGTCTAYEEWGYYNVYDDDGNVKAIGACLGLDENGDCTGFMYGFSQSYYENGKLKTWQDCDLDTTGSCMGDWTNGSWYYTYDDEGNLTSERQCTSINSSGECVFAYGEDNNFGNRFYTYDDDNNVKTYRQCHDVNSQGNCNTYDGEFSYDVTRNGNVETQRFCGTIDDKGVCQTYAGWGYENTYDSNGRVVSTRTCSAIDDNGQCTSYSDASEYIYDDEGNKTVQRYCFNFSGTECTSWDTYYTTIIE